MIIDFRMPDARAIQRLFGEYGPRWIAERINALAITGDAAEIARFEQIAKCYQTIISPLRR